MTEQKIKTNEKIYYNLTQTFGERNCYFRSTDLEQKNWKRLLWGFTDEMLYFMFKGYKILIIDKATKDKNKVERIFVPIMNDLLNWLYFSKEPINNNLKDHYRIAKQKLLEDTNLLTKYKFWKGKVKKIEIQAKTIKVDRENNGAII